MLATVALCERNFHAEVPADTDLAICGTLMNQLGKEYG